MVRYRNYEPCMRERGVYYCRLAKQFMRWAIHMQSIKRWVCWNVSQGSHCTRCRSLLSSTHGKCRPFLPPRPLTPSNSSPNPTRLKFKEVSRMPNHLRWPTPQGTVELSDSWSCCNHRIFWRRGFFPRGSSCLPVPSSLQTTMAPFKEKVNYKTAACFSFLGFLVS